KRGETTKAQRTQSTETASNHAVFNKTTTFVSFESLCFIPRQDNEHLKGCHMKRVVQWLFVAWCLLSLSMVASPVQAQQPRPNIVFILMDDLRFDELGCVGHPFVQTPSIDRLAKEGALFRNAFATTPLCSPSRACFLTGLYAHTHGIIDNVDRSRESHALVT